MKAILLAAGFATRLHPLTLDRAKPLLELGTRTVLDRILDGVEPLADLSEIVVVTNDHFHADFEAWRDRRASSLPVSLVNDGTRCNEERRGGIADMALGIEAAQGADDEDVLVLAGDNILTFGLEPFVADFRRRRNPLLLARRYPGVVPPRRHGEVEVDSEHRIVALREKPEQPRTDLVAVCLYAFPPAVREWVAAYLSAGKDPDAPGHFMAWLCTRTDVFAHVAEGEVFDIGSRESLEEARRRFA